MGGKRREDVIDRPMSWDEVVLKAVPLQEGEEDVNEVGSFLSAVMNIVTLQYIICAI
jgi:hypothetical protein